MASHVREWVTDLQAKGVSPATIQQVRFILSAIFTTALNDVTYLHPCKGVKTPTVPRKPLKIITPEQFDAIYAAIHDATLRLLVETDIESGLRWGELTELRVSDIDLITRVLTVSRTVVQVDPKFHPTGGRFLVKEYPKDKEFRRLKLSTQLTAKIAAHIKDADLGPGGLIFAMARQDSPAPIGSAGLLEASSVVALSSVHCAVTGGAARFRSPGRRSPALMGWPPWRRWRCRRWS
jgi:integrase